MGEILDDIARTVAAGGSRRAALKKIGGTLAGLFLVGLLPKPAAAGPGDPCGGKCLKSQCCNVANGVASCVAKCPNTPGRNGQPQCCYNGVCATFCGEAEEGCCNAVTGQCVLNGQCPPDPNNPTIKGCCDRSKPLPVCVAKCPNNSCCVDNQTCRPSCPGTDCCNTVTGHCVVNGTCPGVNGNKGCCQFTDQPPFTRCLAVCPSGQNCLGGFCATGGCPADCSGLPCGAPDQICDINPVTGPCVCSQIVGGGCSCFQPICFPDGLCSLANPSCPPGFSCVTCCGGDQPFCAALCGTSLFGSNTVSTQSTRRWGN